MQEYGLLRPEASFALFDTPMSITAIWFFSASSSSLKQTISHFELKLSAILTANPWLLGRLKISSNFSNEICLAVANSEDSEHDCQKYLRVLKWTISSQDTHATVARAVGNIPGAFVPSGRYCLTHKAALFQVTLMVNDSTQELAMIVSLNHVIADGATFYKIAGMLGDGVPVETLVFTRVENEKFTEIEACVPDISRFKIGVRTGLSIFWTVLRSVVVFVWMRGVVGRDYFPMRVVKVPPKWVLDAKQRAGGVSMHGSGSDKVVNRISTNDCITSHLFKISMCAIGQMAINLRGRVRGIQNSLAGNYESVILYTKQDFGSPEQIRASISRSDGVFQRITNQDSFPEPNTWYVKLATVTNWAGLYGDRDLQIPGCRMVRHEPLPVVKAGPMPLSLFIIYCIKAGELGVLTNEENKVIFNS